MPGYLQEYSMPLFLFKFLFLIFVVTSRIFPTQFFSWLSLHFLFSPRDLDGAVTANPSHITYSQPPLLWCPLLLPAPLDHLGCFLQSPLSFCCWAVAQNKTVESRAWNRASLGSVSGYATFLLPFKHFTCSKLRKQIRCLPLLHVLRLRIQISLMRSGLRWRTVSLSGCYCQHGQRCTRNCNCPCQIVSYIAWYINFQMFSVVLTEALHVHMCLLTLLGI